METIKILQNYKNELANHQRKKDNNFEVICINYKNKINIPHRFHPRAIRERSRHKRMKTISIQLENFEIVDNDDESLY